MKSIAWRFQSTPPARGATTSCDPRFPSRNDFNPRPPRGGRLPQSRKADVTTCISIHAPREGGDITNWLWIFNTNTFQSTPPARGATQNGSNNQLKLSISIHAPREGGDYLKKGWKVYTTEFQSTPPARGATHNIHLLSDERQISIHAPREGGDERFSIISMPQSISIHAPREGGDRDRASPVLCAENFNPRPPRGGRQQRCTVLSVNL